LAVAEGFISLTFSLALSLPHAEPCSGSCGILSQPSKYACPEAAQNLDQAVTLDPIQAPSLGTAWSPPHAGFHPASLSGLAVLPLRLKVSLQLSSQAKPVEPLSCFPLLWAGPIQASRQGPFRLLIRTQATSILRPSFGQTQNCTQASCGGAFRVYYSAASHSGSAQVKLW